mmetsp:Transcript_38665/g.46634  ORF Transcript_38665/g.46634 Transcript_38665/m.46634 type:complete len:83 (+) Transcript_38665:141-389(+)
MVSHPDDNDHARQNEGVGARLEGNHHRQMATKAFREKFVGGIHGFGIDAVDVESSHVAPPRTTKEIDRDFLPRRWADDRQRP